MQQPRDIITVPEAAQICGVDRVTMWRWVKSGNIDAWITPGGHHRIRRSDLDEFMVRNGMSAEHQATRLPRILIVDDDVIIQQVLSRSLSAHGFEVDVASDGFDAGVKVMQFHPDLIILDLVMPSIDGFEVCRQMKKNDATARIRLVVLTGYGTPENRDLALAAGADVFLKKPVSETVLLSVVEKVLGRRSPDNPAGSVQAAANR